MSYLAIQVIRLRYSDRERGRVEAEPRARLRAMPLEVLAGDGVLHASDGAHATTHAVASPTCIDDALTIHRAADSLALHFADTSATPRPAQLLVELPADAWGRVIWNRKETSHDHKWLVEIVVNAGLFAGPPPAQIFSGTPREERDLRRDFLRNGWR